MPKVLARDPRWLSHSTPGYKLFQPDSDSKTQRSPEARYDGPLRKIAHRGTEVFVAVGNELRWSDLGLLKDAGEEQEPRLGRGYRAENLHQEGERGYRVRRWLVYCGLIRLTAGAGAKDSSPPRDHSAFGVSKRRLYRHLNLAHLPRVHLAGFVASATTGELASAPQVFPTRPYCTCPRTSASCLCNMASTSSIGRLPRHYNARCLCPIMGARQREPVVI